MNKFNDFTAALQSAGLVPTDGELDGLIHDCFDDQACNTNPYCPDTQEWKYLNFYAEASKQASAANNLGVDAQLQYLHEHGFHDKAIRYLRELRSND